MNGRVECARRTGDAAIVTSRSSGSGGPPAALLPGPSRIDSGGAACAMGELYLLVAKRRDRHAESAKVEVDGAQRESHACFERETAALEREHAQREDSGSGLFESLGKIVGDLVDDVVHVQVEDAFTHLRENGEATWNSPKFWAELEDGAVKVGKIAAVAASAAATVASFGAAGPVMVAVIIGVSLSAASFVQDETHILEKLGVGDEAARWASVGCSFAGAIVTAGAGSSAVVGQVSQFSKVMHASSMAASGINGGAKVTAGAAHVPRGEHAALAQEALADRSEAQHAHARLDRQVVALLEALGEADKSSCRTLESLEGAIRTQGQSLVLSTARA